jgi:hypothetical protein
VVDGEEYAAGAWAATTTSPAADRVTARLHSVVELLGTSERRRSTVDRMY